MRTVLIALCSVVLGTTQAGAAVGENLVQLIARYGQPDEPLGLMLGFGVWKTKQGGDVFAMLEEGSAVLMVYGAPGGGVGRF